MCMDIVKDCKNLEQSYGYICVLCNKCGRFDKKTLTKDQRIAELEKENEQLKQQLEEKDKLIENAIVPKFKVGDEVYVIFNEKEIKNFTIRIIESISDKSGIKFIYTTNTWKENGGICSLSSDYNKFYKIKQEAEEALEKLNKE